MMDKHGMATDGRGDPDPALAAAIDALLAPLFAPDAPGAVVLVARRGRVLVRRAHGLAHLELGVPLAPDMVFRVGSITKQFTAVAILMLAEQGKLALDDPITAHLPDDPAHGHRITIEHLLTHTSGIRSYTAIPELHPRFCQDVTVDEVVALLAEQPPEFAPGERWAYNNSGYFLLGAIIERVGGLPYGDFLQQHILGPLGMTRTAYEPTRRPVRGHVAGYAKEADGWRVAPPLSMTWPYAAGALTTSVDDLLRWDEALYGEALLPPAALEQAWTPVTLAGGAIADYGYGWRLGTYAGRRTIEHGGGINGFLSHALRLPEEGVFVAVLTNSTAGEPPPGALAVKIAGLTIGQPYREPAAVPVAAESLDAYTGAYHGARQDYAIARTNGHLILRQPDRAPEELWWLGPDEFFVKDSPTSFAARVSFTRAADGGVTGLVLRGRFRPALTAARIDDAPSGDGTTGG